MPRSYSILAKSHFSSTYFPNLQSVPRFKFSTSQKNKMPSSKGEPTDPELREKVKEEVKSEEKGKLTGYLV